jgi:hypothetical protein
MINADFLDADLADAEKANTYTLLSTETYPFNLKDDVALTQLLYERHIRGTRLWFGGIGNGLAPEKKVCCGQDCLMVEAPCRARRRVLFSLNGFIQVEVFNSYCQICHTLHKYDGRRDGIVNFGNAKLFCVELMMELLEFKLNGGVPTQTYWKSKLNSIGLVMSGNAEVAGNLAHAMKEWVGLSGKLNEMMTCFIRLIDYGPRMFNCCINPKVVCIDGIVLSVESTRIERRHLTEPWIVDDLRRTRFGDRKSRSIITLSAEEKVLIQQYVRDGITDMDYLSLVENHPESVVIDLMGLSYVRTGPEKVKCNPLLNLFYRCIYKDISPCISYVPAPTWSTLEDLLEHRVVIANTVSLLDVYSPVLSQICCFLNALKNWSNFPLRERVKSKVYDLLEALLKKAKDTYIPSAAYEDCIQTVTPIAVSPFDEVLKTGVFFPDRPIVRTLKRVKLTKEPKKCNKDHKKAGRLGAGTLLFWCAEHR